MYQGKYYKQPKSAPAPKSPKEKKPFFRKPTVGTILFYLIYIALIAAFFVGVNKLLAPLEDWLIRYEASQPEQKCQEVFDRLFSAPDWSSLYELAGIEDTPYEGKEAFAVYMQEKSAGKKITYIETSAGLSGDHKYIVKLDEEKIGTFTLTGGAESQTDIPVWELGALELFFTRTASVSVSKLPGQTVYINGVPLDDSFTVRTVSTVAEKYLPEGLHGYRLEEQRIGNLLIPPTVTVTDADGNPVSVLYDKENQAYTVVQPAMEMTDAEKAQVELTLTTFAKYMIKAASLTQVKNCCVPDSALYYDITTIERWMQSYRSYQISPVEFSDFYRYSDTLFSVRAAMTNSVTRNDGTVKDYEMDYTLFFTLDANGKWLLSNMTQVDITEETEMVLLTFMDGETKLDSFFVDTSSNSLTLPAVTVPDGHTFSGWVKQEDDGNGKITLTIVFAPDETNIVNLPGEGLESMTLYTLFETEKS